MQLVITQDIKRSDGGVKWLAREVVDQPRATWQGIAKSAGMELEDFTKPVTAAAEALVKPDNPRLKRGNK